eukprot:120011_1
MSWFGSGKQSQTQILCKKIDIVTSPHIEEPQWDIVMDITDALNNDSGRAQRVLAHLKRILEKSISISSDNQQLKNCLNVIDSLTRNGNDNIISIIHSTFLLPLSKFVLSTDKNSAKLKSLLANNENNKDGRDRVLELILDWQSKDNNNNIDQLKYPNFRNTFTQLQQNGAAFDKIISERERIKNDLLKEKENKLHKPNVKEEKIDEYNDVEKYDNPWQNKNMPFGRWYKSKLKADLSKLIDMICMTQSIIAMKNVNDAMLMCMELREANKRLLSIMLRTKDPPAIDNLLQLVTINASLFNCYKKLKNGQKFILPGVSRQFLDILIKPL